jgi:hypothetical protein
MNLALHFKQVIALECTSIILYNFYFGVCAPSWTKLNIFNFFDLVVCNGNGTKPS